VRFGESMLEGNVPSHAALDLNYRAPMAKSRVFGFGVIGLGAVSVYFHNDGRGVLFASMCLIAGLVMIVASEARGLVSKPRDSKGDLTRRKYVKILVLVKGEVHVYPQRNGKFQEIHDPNQTGLEFDLFIYAWLLDGAELPVGIDDLYLTLKGVDGSRRIAERVAGDLKNWHLREEDRASDEESSNWPPRTVRSASVGLAELDTAAPLECGAPREGWLHFRFRHTTTQELSTGSLELSVWDTFSQMHTAVASKLRRLPGNVWPIPASSPSELDRKDQTPPSS
jgi:hypothetical protein